MKLFYTLGFVSLAVLLSACGEAYQGTYTGQATIQQSCGMSAAPAYSMEAQGTVSGSKIELNITKFQPTNTKYDDSISAIVYRSTPISMDLSDNTKFGVVNKPFANQTNSTYSVDGTINTARDQIDGLNVLLNAQIQDNPTAPVRNCTVQFMADKLLRKN